MKRRIIIRPWMPRKLPFTLKRSQIESFIQKTSSQLDTVIYAGWIRKVSEGKRTIHFIVATGKTATEARKRFKTSSQYGQEVWEIMQTKTQ